MAEYQSVDMKIQYKYKIIRISTMYINKLRQLTSFVGSNEGGFDGEDVGSNPVIKLRQKLPSPVENI